jgi:hypothetical protein
MSITTNDREYRMAQTVVSAIYVLLVGLLAVVAVTAVARADEAPGDRSSTTTHYLQGGRESGPGQPASETRDTFEVLNLEGSRTSPGMTGATVETGTESPALGRSMGRDFWFYDADVVLFGDDDADGHYFGVDLLFDVDTVWSSAVVYAVAYLSYEGGPWNEYAVSEDFPVEGATSDDEYLLITELESGYPTGSYDLLIELYDADTGEFLADFGPESSSALSYLPLEDYNRDAPIVEQRVTVSHGHGGGSAGLLTLLLLGSLAMVSRLRD